MALRCHVVPAVSIGFPKINYLHNSGSSTQWKIKGIHCHSFLFQQSGVRDFL